jgi:hypothetical protein
VVALVVESTIPHFITELKNSQKRIHESSMNGPTPDVPIQDVFALYRRTKTLLAMLSAFCPRYRTTTRLPSYQYSRLFPELILILILAHSLNLSSASGFWIPIIKLHNGYRLYVSTSCLKDVLLTRLSRRLPLIR